MDIFLVNHKGVIFIKEFIERWIIFRIYGPQCSLVNVIDFNFQCPRTKNPYRGTIIELWFYKCFHVLRFSNQMKLDIWQRALIFFPTLKHNSLMWFLNFNYESVVIPSTFLWELSARGIPSIETISSSLVLSKIWDFPGLAFIWLFLNQPKSLVAEAVCLLYMNTVLCHQHNLQH